MKDLITIVVVGSIIACTVFPAAPLIMGVLLVGIGAAVTGAALNGRR